MSEVPAELRDLVAKSIYERTHHNIPRCWKWEDSGLDDEHPGARDRFLRYADGALAVIWPILSAARDLQKQYGWYGGGGPGHRFAQALTTLGLNPTTPR